MPEPAARMTALQAGEVDMIYVPHPDGIAELKTKGFKLEQGPAPHVWYFAFNLKDKNYQDVRVRRAINMAIDREGMAKQLLKGTAVAARGLQAPCCPSYDPNFKDYPVRPRAGQEAPRGGGLRRTASRRCGRRRSTAAGSSSRCRWRSGSSATSPRSASG